MLQVKEIDVYCSAIHALKKLSLEVNGQDRHPDRSQRSRQDHHSNHLRPARPVSGTITKGVDLTKVLLKIVAWGFTVPEDAGFLPDDGDGKPGDGGLPAQR